MPFVLIGLGILGAAGVVAILIKRSDAIAATTPIGATERGADPPSSPTTAFQTTSAAEPPSNTVAEARSDELPDRWKSSSAATPRPIGTNEPEDPFLGMSAPDPRDRNLGYAIDDLTQVSTASPFEDDIVKQTDVANAPAAFGLVSGLLR